MAIRIDFEGDDPKALEEEYLESLEIDIKQMGIPIKVSRIEEE